MASGQYNQGSRVRPNFSRVRLTKIRGRTSATSHLSKKKSLCDSESLSVVQQKTHVRLMSLSKPIRDSEGQTPPLIGHGPDIPVRVCVRIYKCITCAAAIIQRER